MLLWGEVRSGGLVCGTVLCDGVQCDVVRLIRVGFFCVWCGVMLCRVPFIH